MKIVMTIVFILYLLLISGCSNKIQTCSKKNNISFRGIYQNSNNKLIKKNKLDKTKSYQLLLDKKINKNKKEISSCCLRKNKIKLLLKKNRYYILSKGKFNNEDFGDITININEANSNSINNLNKFSKKIIRKFAIKIVKLENSYQKMSKVGENAIIDVITAPNNTNKHLAYFVNTKNGNYYSCKIFYLEKYLTTIVKNIDDKISRKKIHSIIKNIIEENNYYLFISK